MPAGKQLGAHSSSSRPQTFYQRTVAVGSSGAQPEKQGSPELLAGKGAGSNPVLLLQNIHFALVFLIFFFFPPKLFPQPCLFSSGAGVWVTLLTAAALNPHRRGCSRHRREKLEQLLLPGFFFSFFFSNFFFSCLFAPNRSCNSQLKEACQGKAKTNGVHCLDLLFSLEKGHGPILPDFFFNVFLPL